MAKIPRVSSNLLRVGLCVPLGISGLLLQAQTSVRHVKVMDSKDAVEIEVEGSDRLIPQTQVLTGPDRLVVDFPNATPGSQLRGQSVNRGEVKDVRVGLFQSKPPITRVVLDLKTAQSYQVFPYGRTVMIKIVGASPGASTGVDYFAPESQSRPGLVTANYVAGVEHIQPDTPAQPTLDVSFRDGLLAIKANKATLSQVLNAVQQRTGAEVAIAPGAEQETVVVDLAPAPAPEVVARLLNGSKFNFLILSAPNDSQKLDRVILSPRTEGGPMPLPQVQVPDSGSDEPDQSPQGPPSIPRPQPEMNNPPGDNSPDQ